MDSGLIMQNSVIRVSNLTKKYKLYDSAIDRLKEAVNIFGKHYHHDFYALKDISFQINRGETVGIIGKNGSGKSTLLKILTGVLVPTDGIVQVEGTVSALLELGAGFNPELTGLENVYFNGALMGFTRPEMDAKIDEILAFADIGEYAYQPVKMYSSGMFVRLAFSVAINVDPDILIVDEALSVGDVKFQRKCYTKIEEFRERNLTILFVTHDTNILTALCNKALLIDDARVKAFGEPREVTKLYMQLLFGEKLVDNVPSRQQVEPQRAFFDQEDKTQRNSIRESSLEILGVTLCQSREQELRHGNGSAEILDFGIRDSKEKICSVQCGQKYTFFFDAVLYQDFQKLFFSFVVRTIQGVELFYTCNEYFGLDASSKNMGDIIRVTSDVTMWLAPGQYFLSFVIRDSITYDALDRRMDALEFSVYSIDKTVGGFVSLDPDFCIENVYSKGVGEVLLGSSFV